MYMDHEIEVEAVAVAAGNHKRSTQLNNYSVGRYKVVLGIGQSVVVYQPVILCLGTYLPNSLQWVVSSLV